jgi:hypothetical protein
MGRRGKVWSPKPSIIAKPRGGARIAHDPHEHIGAFKRVPRTPRRLSAPRLGTRRPEPRMVGWEPSRVVVKPHGPDASREMLPPFERDIQRRLLTKRGDRTLLPFPLSQEGSQ